MNNTFDISSLKPYVVLVSNDKDWLFRATEYVDTNLPGFPVFIALDPIEAINIMHKLDRQAIFFVDYDLPDIDGFRLITENIRKTFRFDSFCCVVTDNEEREVIDRCSQAVIPCRRKSSFSINRPERKVYNLDVFFLGDIQYAVARLRELELDPLTKLYARKAGEARLSREYQRACRFRVPLSLIYLDVNDLKVTNDTYGHLAGDALLETAASVIRACIREKTEKRDRDDDFAVRWGADEILIGLYNATPRIATLVMSRIWERLRKQGIDVALGRRIYPTLAMGSASLSYRMLRDWKEKESIKYLINKSDEEMYKDKRRIKAERWLEIKKFITNTWTPSWLLLAYSPCISEEQLSKAGRHVDTF